MNKFGIPDLQTFGADKAHKALLAKAFEGESLFVLGGLLGSMFSWINCFGIHSFEGQYFLLSTNHCNSLIGLTHIFDLAKIGLLSILECNNCRRKMKIV